MHFMGKCPAQAPSGLVLVIGSEVFRERLWPEIHFREQRQAESSSHGHVCASRASFGLKSFCECMTERIVLSHVRVSTLRRTRSTQKLISTGLLSGGIITLE